MTGAQPVTGAIYDAWASQSYERGPLGLPTSAEIQEPLQITQNFQHGTLNYDRLTGDVNEVLDGITTPLSTQVPERPDRAARTLLATDAPGGRLGVPSHHVGSSRLIGVWPPSALWRRRVL